MAGGGIPGRWRGGRCWGQGPRGCPAPRHVHRAAGPGRQCAGPASRTDRGRPG